MIKLKSRIVGADKNHIYVNVKRKMINTNLNEILCVINELIDVSSENLEGFDIDEVCRKIKDNYLEKKEGSK